MQIYDMPGMNFFRQTLVIYKNSFFASFYIVSSQSESFPGNQINRSVFKIAYPYFRTAQVLENSGSEAGLFYGRSEIINSPFVLGKIAVRKIQSHHVHPEFQKLFELFF